MDAMSSFLLVSGGILLVGSWLTMIFAASSEDFTSGLCAVFLPATGDRGPVSGG